MKKIISMLVVVSILFGLYSVPVRAENNYNNQWFNAGTNRMGSFRVYSTHSGNIGITLKIETSSPNTNVRVWITNSNGITVLDTRTLTYWSPEWKTTIRGNAGYYTVNYIVSAPSGTRLMCWTY